MQPIATTSGCVYAPPFPACRAAPLSVACAGLVEAVLNGSTLRLTLLPERTPVTVTLAGVQCPSMGKRPAAPAPAAAAPEANGNGAAPEANGTANGNGAAPAAVTAASIAASGVSAASAPGGAEPFSREAKWFTESRVLNREVSSGR